MDQDKEITIADLYPDLSPEEQAEAEERLLKYLDIVRGIFNRLVETGEIDKVLLQIQWQKRYLNKKR
jgi:hypothetical protein